LILDLVDDAFGVTVGGRFVEVGERLGGPELEAVGEGREGRPLCPLDRGPDVIEPARGLPPVPGAVDRAEGLLEPPGR
jgi:hypothetical protein